MNPAKNPLARLAGILAIVLGVLVGGTAIAAAVGMFRGHGEAKALELELLQTLDATPAVISEEDLNALPPPVRRYAAFALGGQREFPYHGMRWEEEGVFTLPEMGAFSMRAWQVSHQDEPRYLWRGVFSRFGGLLTLESRDAFFLTRHDMRAKLWGLVTVMRSDYEEPELIRSLHSYLLLRYYGAAPLYPWVFFTDERIRWEPLDESQAWLIAETPSARGRYLVRFAEDGSIAEMSGSEHQYHGNHELQRESGIKADYVQWQGLKVPSRFSYTWAHEGGATTSYEFKVENLRAIM